MLPRMGTHLGPLARDVDAILARLERDRVVERVWAKDHTLWRTEPAEIADRLGWLDLVREPPPADAELEALVADVRREGLADVVLLGMGGSSLGAEALRASFGEQPGFPRLQVLDSTHPSWVRRVRRAIDPGRTLFLVASKSGTTAEVMAFYRYFRAETEAAVGAADGLSFVAVTDPGTPLARLAAECGFRHTLLNPPDVGGRFSVLSRFGLAAAALAGIDARELLRRAHAMAARTRPGPPAAENPGAWLGAVLGAAVARGRFLPTLLTSARVATIGLWVEQLLAESTGKEGTGALPVTLEPAADPHAYGDRRLFVALRYGRDAELDARVEALAAAGQPVVELALDEPADLGGELFRWEFATAVLGYVLGVQPFDQPNVQTAKTETDRLLAAFRATGRLPPAAADGDLRRALDARPLFVALMSYTDAGEGYEAAIAALRERLLRGFGVATTFGYGPRFLHSTGQFHKGGVGCGLFVQLVAETGADLAIPGEPYGFGTLCQAQAAGDLAALASQGRRALRIDLGDDATAGVLRLVDELG